MSSIHDIKLVHRIFVHIVLSIQYQLFGVRWKIKPMLHESKRILCSLKRHVRFTSQSVSLFQPVMFLDLLRHCRWLNGQLVSWQDAILPAATDFPCPATCPQHCQPEVN